MTQETPTPETDALLYRLGNTDYPDTSKEAFDFADNSIGPDVDALACLIDHARSIERRLQEPEHHVDRLTGMKFSDRVHAALVSRAEAAERERDAVKELLSIHNLGGMTDYNDGPMKRALAAEARAEAMAGLLREVMAKVTLMPNTNDRWHSTRITSEQKLRIDAALSHPLGGKT